MDKLHNPFKHALKSGKLQLGLWHSLSSHLVAEVLADAGFDWILLDTEHAPNELPMVLAELQAIHKIDWYRALVDSSSLRAPCGGEKTGPNPTDRRKLGSKHHLLTDAQGIPLATVLTGANRHDVTQLLPLIDKIPHVRGKVGAPRHRPKQVQGDRAYDSEPHRQALKKRG